VVQVGGVLDWTGGAALNSFITIFWIVGVTNAFNLLDNMDGLCAGIAAITAIALSWSLGPDQQALRIFSAALAGASCGFLVFNFNPASIFMGDAGSLFLGATLAVMTSNTEARGQTGAVSALIVPVLLILIPIFDTTFVTVSRKLSARAASTGGRDHTSHRLVALGFTERQAVLLLYAFAALAAGAAIGLRGRDFREAVVLLALLVVGLALLGVRLAGVSVYGGSDFGLLRDKPFTRLLADFTYKRRIFEVLLDACLVAIAYYSSYVIRFDATFPVYYESFVRTLPLAIACHLAGLFAAGVYRGVWRYIGIADLTAYVKGVAFGTLTTIIAVVFLYRYDRFSRGVFVINTMALFLLLIGSRLSFRALGELAGRYRPNGRAALIYGAGDGGALLVRELRNNPLYGYQPIGFIDDDSAKIRKRIHGLPVFGGVRDLPEIIGRNRPDVVIVSTKNIPAERLVDLHRLCFESGTALMQMDFRLQELLPEPRTSG